MKYILPYLRPYRRQTALAMVLVAFATVCDLLLPTIMNDILNHGVRQSDFAYIVRCCVWMLAVAAAGLAALLAGRKISCDVVAGFNADLRTDVFSLVNNMTFEEFNAIGAAALLSRSTYDIGTVSWVASMISGSLITIPVLFFGGVILALRKDVTMSLILLLFVPSIFLIVGPSASASGPCTRPPTSTSISRTTSCASGCTASASSAHSIRKRACSRRSPTPPTSWPRTSSTPTCRWAF